MTYQDVIAELKQNIIHNIYIFSGEENYLITHAINSLEKLILNPNTKELDKELRDYEGRPNRISFQDLIFSIQTPAFMSKRRLIVLKDTALLTSTGTTYEDSLKALLSETNNGSVIIFWETKVEKRKKKLLQYIANLDSVIVDFQKQDLNALMQWTSLYFRNYGISISKDACENLVERCNREMFFIKNEMDKLRNIVINSSVLKIDIPFLNTYSVPDLRGSIFDLTDALGARDVDKTMQLYQSLLSQGESPVFILFMIARHFRQLLIAYASQNQGILMKHLSIGNYVASKLWKQKNQQSENSVEAIYRLCCETDFKIKSGQISEEMGLDLLLIQANTGIN